MYETAAVFRFSRLFGSSRCTRDIFVTKLRLGVARVVCMVYLLYPAPLVSQSMTEKDEAKAKEEIELSELQVLFAQLRTQLSIMRTGVGVLVGSLSVLFLLLANEWVVGERGALLDYFAKGILALLIVIGLWRIMVAQRKLRAINNMIHKIEAGDKRVDELVV